MNIRPCCCLKPRAGAIVVAILDLIIGLFGVAGYVYLKYIMEPLTDENESSSDAGDTMVPADNSAKLTTTTTTTTTTTLAPGGESGVVITTESSKDSYLHSLYARDIPLFTEIYGIFAILILVAFVLVSFAVWKKSSWAAKGAFWYTIGLIVLLVVTTIGYFVMGYHWHFVVPLDPILFLQIYFTWILYDYTKYFNYSQPLAKPRA